MASEFASPDFSRKLHVSFRNWPAGQILFRVHPATFSPTGFNPSTHGNARFSPISNHSGMIVPTLYAGSTLDCALMETVFHDVPFVPGLKTLSKATHVAGRVYSTLLPTRELILLDLTAIALRKLGTPRSELIDTPASHYPATRQWAVALHRQNPEAEGLIWTSRQDDASLAVMLFGDRIQGSVLEPLNGPKSLLESDSGACSEVLHLAGRLGVYLV